ncbi:hypothetical protein DL766_009986 [Monosporascus sp. MC13-8B]|uniref:Uncharacterized protein n=1 Tax=Monosporascus cannonballus TaxID=155416 RepID=A0ABY0HDE7_9PEZI|nr:hypothetical protein DL762_002484 [Monosporascus cannonballus]RYO98934.1 hypothetical protein DL763_001844 [Monosporascus cannonballus]RYP12166.1 hypothetical protein DL766_009986 [Monosporascus sp. MC13-8B]
MRPQHFLARAVTAFTYFFTEIADAANNVEYSKWMASSTMSRRQGIMTGDGGSSELLQAGFTQKTLIALIKQYPDTPSVRDYIETSAASVVPYVLNATYSALSYPMDRLSNGHALLQLSSSDAQTESFGAAANALRESIDLNRRNHVGGLWYYVYPEWSYLDGMYSYAPFYTLYAKNRTKCKGVPAETLREIYFQVDLLWQRTLNESSGLLVHGYDASRTAVWADPATGASQHVWIRALGWYTMALVDTLELLPTTRTGSTYKELLLEKFQSLMNAVMAAVDPTTGAWWQVMDHPGREGNYIESSGSAMFAYSLLKGARLGYLDGKPRSDAVRVATRAHKYLTETFVIHEGNQILGYNGTVSVCSLNSTATFEYYVNQPIEYNNVLGSNAYILASLEVENLGR